MIQRLLVGLPATLYQVPFGRRYCTVYPSAPQDSSQLNVAEELVILLVTGHVGMLHGMPPKVVNGALYDQPLDIPVGQFDRMELTDAQKAAYQNPGY